MLSEECTPFRLIEIMGKRAVVSGENKQAIYRRNKPMDKLVFFKEIINIIIHMGCKLMSTKCISLWYVILRHASLCYVSLSYISFYYVS